MDCIAQDIADVIAKEADSVGNAAAKKILQDFSEAMAGVAKINKGLKEDSNNGDTISPEPNQDTKRLSTDELIDKDFSMEGPLNEHLSKNSDLMSKLTSEEYSTIEKLWNSAGKPLISLHDSYVSTPGFVASRKSDGKVESVNISYNQLSSTKDIGKSFIGESNGREYKGIYHSAYNTLVHELMHVHTTKALEENPRVKQKITGLLQEARKSVPGYDIKTKEHYFLTNEKEFIAEAFSDVKVMEKLNGIKTNSPLSILKRLHRFLVTLIKVKRLNKGSILEALTAHVESIVTEDLAKQKDDTITTNEDIVMPNEALLKNINKKIECKD